MNPDGAENSIEYLSYNGLGRNPMLWGVPYMTGLAVMCVFMVCGMICGLVFGGVGWLFTLVAIPVLMFVKIISADDDKAVEVLLIEAKWAIIKIASGNHKFYGGTLTIVPIAYSRREKDVKRYFEKTSQR